jgi:hypothetical protein
VALSLSLFGVSLLRCRLHFLLYFGTPLPPLAQSGGMAFETKGGHPDLKLFNHVIQITFRNKILPFSAEINKL